MNCFVAAQSKMERADALAEERTALTNYMRNTLITNELKFKEVRGRARQAESRLAGLHISDTASGAAAACITWSSTAVELPLVAKHRGPQPVNARNIDALIERRTACYV